MNSNGENGRTDYFLAELKRVEVIEHFGGTSVYDIYLRAAAELGKLKSEIVPFYYIFLARLLIEEQFIFSENDKRLNLYNYFVGLH